MARVIAFLLMLTAPALAVAATLDKASLPPAAQKRLAGGETLYNDQYITLKNLLNDYRETKTQIDDQATRNKETSVQLETARKELVPLAAKDSTARSPVLASLKKAKDRQAELQAILAIHLDPPSEASSIKQKLRPDGTAADGKLQGSTAVHPDAPEWRQNSAADLVKSRLESMDYQKALAELTTKQAEAQKELATVELALRQAEVKLTALNAKAPPELLAKEAQVSTAEDQLKTGEDDLKILQDRLKGMREAFLLIEEPIRMKYDVIDWEGDFTCMADLEKTAADLKADIEKARDRIAAESKAAGKPFPADWKPSQQERLDAVLVVIQKTKDAQAKPTKSPATTSTSAKTAAPTATSVKTAAPTATSVKTAAPTRTSAPTSTAKAPASK
jgi:hypothetical protein